ncbi:hypothetical protein DFH09DRAFT_1069459 [Mycena vulgaris]|nr:hypothetical protein DFH09DRAFT_1069459 [Mycena vulgaris]
MPPHGGVASVADKALRDIGSRCRCLAQLGFSLRYPPTNQEWRIAEGRRLKPSSGKGKGKEKYSKNSANMFRVVSIYVLTCGTKFIKGELQLPDSYQKVPDKIQIQRAVLHGHSIVEGSKGIEFDRTCDHDEFVDALSVALPHPLAYFKRLEEESDDDEPSYGLPEQMPITAKVRARAASVSRKQVPREIIETWAEPEALSAFRNPEGDYNTNDSDSGDDEDASTSPEPVPRRSKRRAADDTQGDDDQVRKKRKSSVKGPSSLRSLQMTWQMRSQAQTPHIDLTKDTSADNATSIFLSPPPKPNPVNPKFSNDFKVDPTLGDPDADQMFEF